MWCGGRRRAAVAGSSARRGSCGGSSSAPRRGQKRACARTRAEGRGRGAGERNGGGGGPSSWHERAATVAGGGGAYRASESGIGAGLGGRTLSAAKFRPTDEHNGLPNARGKKRSGGKQGAIVLERGVRGGRRAVQCASRAGRGAAHRHEGGGIDTMSLSLQRRRNKEVPTAVPPRGVEPRTLPTNRTTGRPGQRVKSRRNLEKGPPGQPTQAVRMVQGEGLRGLRAKVRGEGGCDRWGHALTMAHARSCLADPRTDSTCSLHLWRAKNGAEWQWPDFRPQLGKSAVTTDGYAYGGRLG